MRETLDESPRELLLNTRVPLSADDPLFRDRSDELPPLNELAEELPLEEPLLSEERNDGLESLRILGPSENDRLLLPPLNDRIELPESPLLNDRNERLLPLSPLLKERIERLPPSLNERMELLLLPLNDREEKLLPPPPPP